MFDLGGSGMWGLRSLTDPSEKKGTVQEFRLTTLQRPAARDLEVDTSKSCRKPHTVLRSTICLQHHTTAWLETPKVLG